MRAVPALFLSVLFLVPCPAQEVQRFRQWMMGQEVGGMEVTTSKEALGERIRERSWTHIERKLDDSPGAKATVLDYLLEDDVLRGPDGSLRITWSVSISAEPLQGTAEWSPQRPGILRQSSKNGSPQELPVPAGAVLWPGEADSRLREAARTRSPIHLTQYSIAEQQWSHLDAEPVGPEPLPGFPDAVRFKGRDQAGSMSSDLVLWISPRQGEIKCQETAAGLVTLLQRGELPAPNATESKGGFFERTLAKLPPHPFLLWIPEVTLHWKGQGRQVLPEDDQQKSAGEGSYLVRRTALPSPEEAKDLPVKGTPSAQEAAFLAPSPLVPFRDEAFEGILQRLHAPPGATRWKLAKLVTHFTYDWITDKDLSVGFASALEVAHRHKGDCTEHGVFAVALLRRLGVPARGAVGWVALEDMVGLHFWVEVKLKDRWVPVDPTFDLAPASTLRLKMATTDLADLGSLGWDTAALNLVDGAWVPMGPWAAAIRVDADCALSPDGTMLRVPGARWSLKGGLLQLLSPEAHEVQTCIRPGEAMLREARLLMSPASGRKGWWKASSSTLWMDLGESGWLQVSDCSNGQAFRLLDQLELRTR